MNTNHIHWLGHATFRIEDGATQIYIDPWKLPARSPKADIILITHAHYDHFSPEDLAKVRKPTTAFMAPKDVAYELEGTVISVVPGQSYEIGGLKVRTFPAYNVGKKFHPKDHHWVGYLVTLTNGQKVYHSGDTDFIPEMKGVVADVAMLPCGGTYTMTAKEAAEAANAFKPAVLIPMHWGDIVGTEKDSEELWRLFKGQTLILKPER
jgi:L-ascorbate metabolism protein UlaG (beta-lactamase superfamily)